MVRAQKDFFQTDSEDFRAELESAGFERYRAGQISAAVFKKFIFDPDKMPSIPKSLKDWLAKNWRFKAAKMVGEKSADDSTRKYLFELEDGKFVESVLLKAPDGDGKTRKTLCISTQVGCACSCRFCASGLRGFFRNLTAAEIVSQALPFAGEARGAEASFEFENIVVMGMGEPLLNVKNLMSALDTFNSPDKFGFGARRITVSTCGIADEIERLAEAKFPFRLAISLHGADDEVRSSIMPINKKYGLEKLVNAAAKFSQNCGRMITLEYILIKNVNDTFGQARKLAKIAKRLHAHVNLIPYNRVEGLEWRRSDAARRAAFAKILKAEGVSFTLRREKGAEIDAACGQLALKRSSAQA